MRRQLLRGCVVLFASGLACASGCECGREPALAPPILRLAGRDDVPTLDPAIGYDTRSWMFEDAIFNTLLDYDDGTTLVPELATGWEVGRDGLVYRFRLRTDVRFTNGRPVVADDIKYSLERILDPATRSPGAEFYRGLTGSQECRAGDCHVKGIRVVSPDEIEFHLRAPDPLFLHKLALQFAAVVPREEVRRWGEDFSRHVVGSGPFRMARWDSGRRLLLLRNADYYRAGDVKLAGVEYRIGLSEELAWYRFQAGQLDLSAIPAAEFQGVVRDPRYASLIRKVTSLSTIYLGMNCAQAPFSDVRVRRAVNYAVDRRKVLRLINGRGVVAHGVLPPGMPGFQPRLRGYAHDPERARLLLRAAGYANGFSTTLWVRLDEDSTRLAQGVQQDLREVGIKLTIRALAWGPFLQKIQTPGAVPMFHLGWQADFPDASNFLETLFHSRNRRANNHTSFSDPRLDALLDQARSLLDPTARMRKLQAAERLVVQQAAWVFLYHPVTYRLVQPRVRGYKLHALRPLRFSTIELADTPVAVMTRLRESTSAPASERSGH